MVLSGPRSGTFNMNNNNSSLKYKQVLRGLSNNLQSRATVHGHGGLNLHHRGHHNSFTSPRNIFYELSVVQARRDKLERQLRGLPSQNNSQLQVTSSKIQAKTDEKTSTAATALRGAKQQYIADEDLLSEQKINLLIQQKQNNSIEVLVPRENAERLEM